MAYTLRRPAARVVLLDPQGRVLLINGRDPADPAKESWWEIPGGGVDPWESHEDCVRRELKEEAGVFDADIGPCVWIQHNVFDFGGLHFDQHERIHVAWCEGGECAPTALEALEALAFGELRWWSLEDLLATDFPTFPARLREFLPALVAGELPAEPVDIGVLDLDARPD